MISWLIPRFNNFNMALENMTPNVEKGEYILKLFSHDLFESFKWDIYDYPCAATYWKHQSEYEIHLIRKTTGKAFIGDYIGEFGPGCLMAVGPNLPHSWISDLQPGKVVQERDIVLQFDMALFTRAVAIFPEVTEIIPLLNTWHRGLQFHG